jgi:hypothetical protein
MRADQLPAALLAVVAFAAMAPAWTHYLGEFSAASPEGALMAAMVLPAAAALLITSWVKPELSGQVLGLFVVVGVMVTAPWWWRASGLAASVLAANPLAQTLVQAAVPVLVLAAVASIGFRRVRA